MCLIQCSASVDSKPLQAVSRSRKRDEGSASVEGLPVARTRSGGSADDRPQGPSQRHDDVLAYESGRDVDKFERFGLTQAPAKYVAPPLVVGCFANLECKVIDTRLVHKFNLFVLEVLKAWIDPTQKNPKTIHHHGYGRFTVDGETIKLRSRMP
jgi:hypothetical protein